MCARLKFSFPFPLNDTQLNATISKQHMAAAQAQAQAQANPESVLMSARRFALGGTGYAGEVTAAEQACVALIRSRDTEAINRILSSNSNTSTLAGQLYALWALRHLDPERFAIERARYEKQGGTVEFQSGCCIDVADASDALRWVDSYTCYSLQSID